MLGDAWFKDLSDRVFLAKLSGEAAKNGLLLFGRALLGDLVFAF